jgi:O-methyltransferase involved in polyketide biosynthesis
LIKKKRHCLYLLYGKAIETQKKNPILYDTKAVEIIKKIDYDFKSLKIPGKTNTMMCLRAKLIDNFTDKFLKERNDTVVLHLGCGLDSRYSRIDSKNANWYDLDFEEVISIRKEFFQESDRYHLIASSVTQLDWIENIPHGHANYLVIAEGLFMYLKEDEIKALLNHIKKRTDNYTLIFDTYSIYTAKKVKHHPSIRKTGAQIRWGVDNNKELEIWNSEFKFNKAVYFTSNEEIEKVNWGTKLIYKIADLFPIARNAQRILIYDM